MKREFLTTGDGSVTIHLPDWDEQYHSKHGAITEAQHVFINTGLHHYIDTYSPKQLSIMEIGFGTGLNAFLTFMEAIKLKQSINYVGLEAYPVAPEEVIALNYAKLIGAPIVKFQKLHETPWESAHRIHEVFSLTKRKQFFDTLKDVEMYHLIYFDAFGARVQPELWTETIFQKMFNSLVKNGVLVTYAAKGSVRRAMQSVGFAVERLPGPPGKREMLRATKPDTQLS